MHTLLFNLFASLALVSATMVIVSGNPIHSVIFLILVFCNAAGLLILLKIEFLAMMFLIIYVGAIAVLFLFIVMMLNIKVNEINENWLRYLPIGGIISVIFLTELGLVLGSGPMSFLVPETDPIRTQEFLANAGSWAHEQTNAAGHFSFASGMQSLAFFQDHEDWVFDLDLEKGWSSLIDPVTNIQSLGYLIYTYYFYYFLMASLILLIAMIGAIVLTMYKRKNASKKQFIFKQVSSGFSSAIGYVKENGGSPSSKSHPAYSSWNKPKWF